MPTIKIVDDNTVQFLDADGNLLAEQRYADADTALEIVDGDGNPLPLDTGPIQTPSLSTEDLTYAPYHSRLIKDSNQTVANSTLAEVSWETAQEDKGGFADLSNNALTVPSGFNKVRVSFTARFASDVTLDAIAIFKNGESTYPGGTDRFWDMGTDLTQTPRIMTDWIDAQQGDTYKARIRQIDGSSRDIVTDDRVWFSLEAM